MLVPCADAFSSIFSGRKQRGWRPSANINDGNYGGVPPRGMKQERWDFDDYSECEVKHLPCVFNESYETTCRKTLFPRGGATSNSPTDNVVKGTRATLMSTASYWSQTLESVRKVITAPILRLRKSTQSLFLSSQQKREAELLRQLETLPVRRVLISDNSTVVPEDVVQIAATRSGLLGQPLRLDRVQQFAQSLKSWYQRNGFVLHAITGATLNADTATAEIAVYEPRCTHPNPVDIKFCKEMVIDEETGTVMTLRQYRNHHLQRRTFGFRGASTSKSNDEAISKDKLNTTMVPAVGRTNPSRIASALGLHARQPFRWDSDRWNQVLASGVFSRVFHATHQEQPDGSVQLQILATEAPARHLEYGVGKSLYSGSWEGALEFEHINLLGGGERLSLSVRRGTNDAEPSARISFTDGKFGQPGRYDCEIFSECIGEKEGTSNATIAVDISGVDPTLDRKGATYRIHDKLLHRSMSSFSVEQTVTKAGRHENIGSTTLSVGPYVKEISSNARANFDSVLTVGTRIRNKEGSALPKNHFLLSSRSLLPYWSLTATTRQIFPITVPPSLGATWLLAFRHSVTASSRHIPQHVAKAQGTANLVRGLTTHDEVYSAIQSTAELRIPFIVPLLDQSQQMKDTSIVIFGDLLYACREVHGSFSRKSGMGIGARANIKGFPLKVDLCCLPSDDSNHSYKLKPHFGVGGDFSV